MSGKDIWTTDEGRQMCRHGDLSHSLNTSCPGSDLCVCKHGEGEHNRTQCWHVLWVDGSHHEICRCTGYRVRHSKPPLVLPTEPTWGIVLSKTADRKDGHTFDLGRWAVYGDEEWSPLERTHRSQFDTPCDVLSRESIADFIELTPEQVQRIEAAR